MALCCTVTPALINRKVAVKTGITKCVFAKAALAVCFLVGSSASEAQPECVFGDEIINGLTTVSLCTDGDTDSIELTSTGEIVVSSANAIQITDGSNGVLIDNAGNIESSIFFSSAVLVNSSGESEDINYAITNQAGASIVATGSGGQGIRNNDATLSKLDNQGKIEALLNGVGVQNVSTGVILQLENGTLGRIQGSEFGIVNQGGIGSFVNDGTVASNKNAAIFNAGTITNFTNSGKIGAFPDEAAIEVAVENRNTIADFTNKGSIEGAILNQSTIGTLTNSGTIKKSGVGELGGHAIYSKDGTITNGIINTGTLDGDVTLGVSTLNLNGTSPSITGSVYGDPGSSVNVNGMFTSQGIFQVGHFEVASGATFNMAHDVTTTSSDAFQNDGVVSIAATDEVTIRNGPYDQGASGVLRINVTDDTTYGKLIVSGEANLPSDAKIDVNVTDPNFDFTVSRMEGVLTASTLNSDGTFDVTDNSVLFDFSAEKDNNAIDLLLSAALEDSCASPVADSRSGPCGIGSGFTLDAVEVVSTGTIQGGDVGVGMYDSATTVTNAGTISGNNQGAAIAEGATVDGIVNNGSITGDKAIQVGAGATITSSITNNVDSQLSGVSGAILNVSASITEIVNRGIISSDSDAAVLNQRGEDQSAEPAQIGTLTNFSTGTISGVTHGVANMGSEIFTLTNAGTIEATSTQNAGFDAGILNLAGGIGELNNQEGGLISGATGVYNYEATIETFTNAGTIKATGTDGYAIQNLGTITNGITNTGTLDGEVALGAATLNLNGTSSRVTGAVTGDTGSQVNVNGTFTVESTFNVDKMAVAEGVELTNNDTITTTDTSGLSITGTDVTIINNGVIEGDRGIDALGISAPIGYSLVNNADSRLSGDSGAIRNVKAIVSEITNRGTISSTAAAFAVINQLQSSITTFINAGEVSTARGAAVQNTGDSQIQTMTNLSSGTILGVDQAVLNIRSLIETLNNAGTISATATQDPTGEGYSVAGISNLGLITTLNNQEGGLIDSVLRGVYNADTGTITTFSNAGTIKATSSDGYAIQNLGTITNGINNTGTLDGKVALGAATVNLNGESSRVTGAVTGGANSSVNVNGTFTTENTFNVGAMTVASGGLFTMGHNITAGTFTNQGTLAVGTGTRTLTGNYTQTSGGVFRTTVASDTEYGKLAVSGTATLAGKAEVTVAGAATALTQGGVLEGVITADKIEGEFAEVTTTSSIYTFNGLYSATSFGLQVVAPEPEVIEDNVQRFGSPAALGAAKTLDALASDPGTMAPVLDTLDGLSEQAQSDAVEQTLPVIVAGGSMASSTSQTAFNRVLQARQAALAGMSSGEEFAGTRDIWGKAFGGWANQGDLNNVSGYSVDSGGLAFGLDRQLSPKANLGLALAYAYSSVKSNSTVAPSSVTVNSFQLGVYGDYQIEPTLQLNYQIDGAINTNSSSRDLSRFAGTPGVGSSAKGSYNSYVGHVGLGLKKFVNVGSNTRFTPELRLDYMTVQSDGYTESGGGLLDLRVSSQSYDTLYTGLDLRIDHELSNGINLMANVGAAYNALDNSVQMTSAYQGGGAAFVTDGLKVSSWIYNAGVGVSGMVSKNVELNLRYDIDFSTTSYTNQMVSARVRVLF